ncbi:MAG: flexitail domain-containing putative surface protein, partial [Dehalococcoidia bacterium]
PQQIPVTIESTPPGLLVTMDGFEYSTPSVVDVVNKSSHVIFAPSPQTPGGGVPLAFSSWSDGGAQNHAFPTEGPSIIRVFFKDLAADTDGDTIPNGSDLDDDNDGCTDVREVGPNASLGGLRNPHVFWDFFDTPTLTNVRDRIISVGDLFRIVQRFGTNDVGGTSLVNRNSDPLSKPGAGYHPAFDRSPPSLGGDPWDLGPPDGTIAANDILFSVRQFGHTCSGA